MCVLERLEPELCHSTAASLQNAGSAAPFVSHGLRCGPPDRPADSQSRSLRIWTFGEACCPCAHGKRGEACSKWIEGGQMVDGRAASQEQLFSSAMLCRLCTYRMTDFHVSWRPKQSLPMMSWPMTAAAGRRVSKCKQTSVEGRRRARKGEEVRREESERRQAHPSLRGSRQRSF